MALEEALAIWMGQLNAKNCLRKVERRLQPLNTTSVLNVLLMYFHLALNIFSSSYANVMRFETFDISI